MLLLNLPEDARYHFDVEVLALKASVHKLRGNYVDEKGRQTPVQEITNLLP